MDMEIGCPRCRTALVVPSRESTARRCPVCALAFEVSGRRAYYDPALAHEQQEVTCPVDGTVATMPWRDGLRVCPGCGGDIVVREAVARHEPMGRVRCPSTRGYVLVGLGTEHVAECECGHSIVVIDGEAEHIPVLEVVCPARRAAVAVVAVSDLIEGPVACPWCDGAVVRQRGRAVHRDRPPTNAAAAAGIYVLVHGFWNDADKDYRPWRRQLERLGWLGAFEEFQWSAPLALPGLDLAIKPALVTAMAAATTVGPVTAAAAAAFAPAAAGAALIAVAAGARAANQVIESWQVAKAQARREGPCLAARIRALSLHYDDVRVLGFSLGTAVVHHALRDLAQRPPRRKLRVRLCGGAFPVGVSWKVAAQVVHGPIMNYHSREDRILQILYRAGNLHLGAPIGLNGLTRMQPSSRVRNVVARANGVEIGHSAYEESFAQFGAL